MDVQQAFNSLLEASHYYIDLRMLIHTPSVRRTSAEKFGKFSGRSRNFQRGFQVQEAFNNCDSGEVYNWGEY